MLVTGFTAFGEFDVNPAEEIARQVAEALGARFYPLEVGYDEADDFLDLLQPNPPPAWLMFGVAGRATDIRIETLARNAVGTTPDVLNRVLGPGPIRPDHPDLPTNLWPPSLTLPPGVLLSDNAGDYLCNYLYFNARRLLPTVRSGFVHVVRTEVMPVPDQVAKILDVARQLHL